MRTIKRIGLCVALFLGALTMSDAKPSTPFYADKKHLMVYLDGKGKAHPVQNVSDWKKRRAHILANMQEVMGPMPDEGKRVALDLQVLGEEDFPAFVLRKVTFAAEKDDRVPAYLLIPKGLKGKAPAMLCLHQTTKIGKGEPAGVGGLPNLHCAQELAERGYVALAPDYPNYGDYQIDVYGRGYVSATMKGIWNHMRAVDLLQSLPEVDGKRIGCIGHSLGGHNSLYVATFDKRIQVVVSSCGFNSFAKYFNGDLTGWSHKGYMPRIAEVYGKDPAKMPFDFTEILGAMAPRPVFINAPTKDSNFLTGVDDCVEAARPVYALFGAADRLVITHPDCEHDFPPDIREAAYRFVDGVLEK